MKFLIDECLSPELVGLARGRGFHGSMHVTWLGMASRKDWSIVRRAVEDEFVLVTNNAMDFRALYERQEIHVGLVLLSVAPGLMRLETQMTLFGLALDRLGEAEPVNEVLELTLTADGKVIVERYALPLA